MKIYVNGEEKEFASGITMEQLIILLQLIPANIVAECSGRILNKEEYPTHVLNEDDKVELIRFVGGG